MKKSAVRAYRETEQDRETVENSSSSQLTIDNNSLSQLMHAWKEAESTMERIFEHEAAGAVSLRTDAALRERFERRLRSIEARQVWLIERMAELPAKSIDEVLKKLVLWRSMSVASSGDNQELTPAERLIVGAISDLEAFLGGGKRAVSGKL